jgi:basic membrane protein A
MKKLFVLLLVAVFSAVVLATGAAMAADVDYKKVAGIWFTPIDDPWTNAVHQGVQKAATEAGAQYDFTEKVGSADFERVIREYAERGYGIIFGDAFGAEEACRRAAKDYPEIAFSMGSAQGPAAPNLAVWDSYTYEAGYLAGMIAGSLTKTNIIGDVGGMAIPEANRLHNAFILGAKEVNPNVKIKIAFIGTFFDPPKVKEAAIAQIEAGADIIFSERYGGIDAAKQKGVLAIGNMVDQNSLAPDTVVTGPVWNFYLTAKATLDDVYAKKFEAKNYKKYNLMPKGGSQLAPYHGFDNKIPQNVKDLVTKRSQEIMAGNFTVPFIDDTPKSD